MYRIKDRKVTNKASEEIVIPKSINYFAHYFHAIDHEWNILFTTEKASRENVNQIILALSETEQLIGELVAFGKFGKNDCIYWSKSRTDEDAYIVPSQWENQHQDEIAKNYAWYEIKNLRELESQTRNRILAKNNPNHNFDYVFKDTQSYHNVIQLEYNTQNSH